MPEIRNTIFFSTQEKTLFQSQLSHHQCFIVRLDDCNSVSICMQRGKKQPSIHSRIRIALKFADCFYSTATSFWGAFIYFMEPKRLS